MNHILTGTDSYKVGHWKAYPADMTRMYSYLESRGGMYDESKDELVTVFENGELTRRYTLDEIRQRLRTYDVAA